MILVIENDYTVVDNLGTITYTVKTGEGTYAAPVSIPHVLQRVTKKMLTAGNQMMRLTTAVFHVWNTQTTIVPKSNDRLTDADGVNWIVKGVDIEALNTRYRLDCQIAQ